MADGGAGAATNWDAYSRAVAEKRAELAAKGLVPAIAGGTASENDPWRPGPCLSEDRNYGEEWRKRAREGKPLSPSETRQWARECAWEQSHAGLVQKLDAMVGRTVRMREEHETLDGETIPAGTEFWVSRRDGKRLIAQYLVGSTGRALRLDAERGVLLLRLEWIALSSVESQFDELRPLRPEDLQSYRAEAALASAAIAKVLSAAPEIRHVRRAI